MLQHYILCVNTKIKLFLNFLVRNMYSKTNHAYRTCTFKIKNNKINCERKRKCYVVFWWVFLLIQCADNRLSLSLYPTDFVIMEKTKI